MDYYFLQTEIRNRSRDIARDAGSCRRRHRVERPIVVKRNVVLNVPHLVKRWIASNSIIRIHYRREAGGGRSIHLFFGASVDRSTG